jgi:uncharacterized membrane protein
VHDVMGALSCLAVVLLCFVLPVLYLIHHFTRGPAEPRRAPDPRTQNAQRTLAVVVVAVAAAMATYRMLAQGKLEQTAALFLGIPTLLAVIVIFAVRPASLTGTVCKAITVGLLMAGLFLGEGFICLVMAAPLFYAVGVLAGSLVEAARRRSPRGGTVASCLLVLVLVPMSFEGVTPELSLPREETVTAECRVAAPPVEVMRSLALAPRFAGRLPAFLRLGFPRPVRVSGSGLTPGSRRTIHFAGGEGKPGDLVLEVAEAGSGRVRFHTLSDASKVAHWLAWEDAVVEWWPEGAGRTRVRWTQSFRRDLDPAWYFGPWERYAVGLAAGYLIESAATPAERWEER